MVKGIGMKPTILLADDDGTLLELLELRCRSEGWEVVTVDDGMTAISAVDVCRPDAVVLDLDMPGGNGFSVCEMMASDKELSRIPIVVLTGRTDSTARRRCRRFNAHYLVKGPRTWERLRATVREVLQTRAHERRGKSIEEPTPTSAPGRRRGWAQSLFSIFRRQDREIQEISQQTRENLMSPHNKHSEEKKLTRSHRSPDKESQKTPCLLHIEDDADLSAALKTRLESHGVAVIRTFDGTDGYRTAMRYPVDVILLDFELPNGQGDYVLRRLKETAGTQDIPVVVLTGRSEKHIERQMLNMGAERVLNKPVHFKQLFDALSEHLDLLARPSDLNGIRTVMADSSLTRISTSREQFETAGV